MLGEIKLNYVLKSQKKVIKFKGKTKRIVSYLGKQKTERTNILLR